MGVVAGGSSMMSQVWTRSCLSVTRLVLPWFYRVLLGFTGFYWVLLGFTGFYWVLLGFHDVPGLDEVLS